MQYSGSVKELIASGFWCYVLIVDWSLKRITTWYNVRVYSIVQRVEYGWLRWCITVWRFWRGIDRSEYHHVTYIMWSNFVWNHPKLFGLILPVINNIEKVSSILFNLSGSFLGTEAGNPDWLVGVPLSCRQILC